ncbi:MAG TPA: L-seryl-tRNA(Sec) selenium transferase [Chthoniobacterales bacterium]|jgi:L-seryl-tRNA(Ser) seleniumtransferase
MTTHRAIPAVGKLLEELGEFDLPRPIVARLVRQHLAHLRTNNEIPARDEIIRAVRENIARLEQARLQPIVNGTGIILHTNFGRAPLGPATLRALNQIAGNYNNLEYDLTTGSRGRRGASLESALALLCQSEAATVVNNCAAALVLIVRHFTKTKPEVIISRGELVQIGDGFRIGEIVAAAGARLREVGATNKTTLDDYASAIGSETALILRVHQSNFFMSGFAEVPPNDQIARLARARRIPLVTDLGSGVVFPPEKLNLLEGEPTPAQTLKSGAALVCFSGDKLFGGPQAGIIVGKKTLITAVKREPLFRALRCDKLIFAALQAIVDAHLRQDWQEIPAIHLLQVSLDHLRTRADTFVRQLADLPLQIRVIDSTGEMGGGTLPRTAIPSISLELSGGFLSPDELALRLRHTTPPVIGYIMRGGVRLDLRTIFPKQDEVVVNVLRRCLTKPA